MFKSGKNFKLYPCILIIVSKFNGHADRQLKADIYRNKKLQFVQSETLVQIYAPCRKTRRFDQKCSVLIQLNSENVQKMTQKHKTLRTR